MCALKDHFFSLHLFVSPSYVGFVSMGRDLFGCVFSPGSELYLALAVAVVHFLLMRVLGRNMHPCVGILRLPNLCEDAPSSTSCT